MSEPAKQVLKLCRITINHIVKVESRSENLSHPDGFPYALICHIAICVKIIFRFFVKFVAFVVVIFQKIHYNEERERRSAVCWENISK